MATAESVSRPARSQPATGDRSVDVELPDDLPGRNDLVNAVFAHYHDAGALELLDRDRVLYLVPWGNRHSGIAGYEQSLDDFEARPREFTPAEVRGLLEAHHARPVPLAATPAWVLDPRGAEDVRVSWHARVRWGERIHPTPDPGPAIRAAYREGVNVGIKGGHGRYYAPEDVLLTAVYDHGTPLVTTVFQPEDFDRYGTEHLAECERCEDVYDPSAQTQAECECCGGRVCPWCGAAN